MESSTLTEELLEQLLCPAFLVKDGKIIRANNAALQLCVQPNTQVGDIIENGSAEYLDYTEGQLCLTLCINELTYSTTVTAFDSGHLFCIESDYEDAELRAFALAAQSLRDPLTNAMISAEQLLSDTHTQNYKAQKYAATINRGLHQLLRAISNMTDVSTLENDRYHMQEQDVIALYNSVLERAAALVEQNDHKLTYTVPKLSAMSMVDAEKLERATLNLVSNAIKYSPKDSIVTASVSYRNNKLLLTVENDLDEPDPTLKNHFFSRYLRMPGIEDGRRGIGLGLSIVRNVANRHGGTVLMECPNDSKVRVTMTISLKQTNTVTLKSPVFLPVDYTGGIDHTALELSDVLAPSAFNGKQ